MTTPDLSSMSDDELFAQLPPRKPASVSPAIATTGTPPPNSPVASVAPAAPPAPPTGAASATAQPEQPDLSKMSDDELFAALPPRKSAQPGAAPAAPPKPERSLMGDLGHGLGLAGRTAVNAIAAPVAMAADFVAAPVNAGLALYDKLRDPTADEQANGGKKNGFRFPNQAQALNSAMDSAGVAKPESAIERVGVDAAAGVGSAVTGMGIGGILSKAAGPLARSVGAMLAEGPKMQMASGAASGAASGLTREAGGGEIAQGVAGLAGALLPGAATAPFRSVADPARRQLAASAQKANEAGYVIPPVDLNDGAATGLASAISGKIKTSQEASFRNQSKSNDMARKALGLSPEQSLDADALAGIRKEASRAYEPVASAGMVVPGAKYSNELDDAVSVFSSQAKSFPGMPVPPVVSHIEAMKTAQFDSADALNAIKVLRGYADTAYRAGDKLVGSAYKKGAAALEGAIEDHLVGLGAPATQMLKDYRDARQMIAKTYDVQGALNETTGNVNAIKLAADLKKGKPLSNELRTIAETGQAFPKAMQALKEAPGKNSVLDVVTALGGSAVTGSPIGLVGLAARPALRSALLSNAFQNSYVKRAGNSPTGMPKGTEAIAVNSAAMAASPRGFNTDEHRAYAEAKKKQAQAKARPPGL